jgi:hypothetical protein
MWSGSNTEAQLLAAFKTAVLSHSKYVEVYMSDIVNPSNVTALRYLAGA